MNSFKGFILMPLFFLSVVASVICQNYVGEIEKLLYPVNVDTIIYERECRTGKISIVGRDFYPSENKIDSLLFLIIERNDTNDFKPLQNLFAKAERTFLSEWEPDWCGYSYRYESFYHPLTAMEHALQSIHINQNIQGVYEKYFYLKNLLLCGRGSDRCINSSVKIFSPYINSKNRACWGYFCSDKLLDLFWLELKPAIIRDLCDLPEDVDVDFQFRAYYYTIIVKSRGNDNGDFDSCFTTKWDVMEEIKINPDLRFNYGVAFSVLSRQNVAAYKFLVDKINFDDKEEAEEILGFISQNPLMVQIVKKRLEFLIGKPESLVMKKQYVKNYVDLITESTLKNDLKILKPYLSKETLSIMKAQFEK